MRHSICSFPHTLPDHALATPWLGIATRPRPRLINQHSATFARSSLYPANDRHTTRGITATTRAAPPQSPLQPGETSPYQPNIATPGSASPCRRGFGIVIAQWRITDSWQSHANSARDRQRTNRAPVPSIAAYAQPTPISTGRADVLFARARASLIRVRPYAGSSLFERMTTASASVRSPASMGLCVGIRITTP